jgi:exosortase H (IPTLxxWG-CTERM-specific)
MVALYALIAWNPVNDHVIVPLTEGIAGGTAVVLRAVNGSVERVGTEIRSSRFAIDVKNGCNGVEAAILLAAAVFAFPATVRSRVAGLVAGVVAIQLLNVVRLSSLFWLGENHRRLFDLFHVAVWQSIVILAAISIFVVWSLKFAEKPLAHSR